LDLNFLGKGFLLGKSAEECALGKVEGKIVFYLRVVWNEKMLL